MTDAAAAGRRPAAQPDRIVLLPVAAAALSLIAAVVSRLDGDDDLVPFFAILTFVAVAMAWLVSNPAYRVVLRALAIAWICAAIWVAVLLVMYQAACGCSSSPPLPEATYLGLRATAYHLAATYVGLALVVVTAYGRRGRRSPSSPPVGSS